VDIYGRFTSPDPLNSYGLSVNVTQPIFNLYNFSYLSQTKANKEYSEIGLDYTKQNLIYSIKEKYYNILKTKRLVDVDSEAVNLSRKQLEKAKSLYEIGAVSKTDVLKAEVELSNSELNLINSMNEYENATAILNYTLGFDINSPLKIIDDLEVIESIDDSLSNIDSIISTSLENRLDLQQVKANIKVQSANIGIAKSRLYPTLFAFGGYDWSNTVMTTSRWIENDRWNIGVQLSWLLFDGFGTYTDIKNAKTQIAIAQQDKNQLEKDIALQVKQVYLKLISAKKKIAVMKESVKKADEDLRLADELYKIGSTTILDLLDARVRLSRTRTQYIQALYDYKIAKAELEKVMGKKL
jgi:outer membrane protein TolC